MTKSIQKTRKKKTLNLRLEDELFQAVLDYQFAKRLPSRLASIRQILRAGLRAEAAK
jgi:hypothetical protein